MAVQDCTLNRRLFEHFPNTYDGVDLRQVLNQIANVADTALLWLARLLIAFLVFSSVPPLLSSGAWFVRLFDFPRLQLFLLASVTLAILFVGMYFARHVSYERFVLLLAGLTVGLWQLMYVIPFTPVWPKEIAHSDNPDAVRLMIANVEVNNQQHADALRTIGEHDADLLLVIEINDRWREAFDPLTKKYPHRTEVIRDEGLGMALWSKLPVSNVEVNTWCPSGGLRSSPTSPSPMATSRSSSACIPRHLD